MKKRIFDIVFSFAGLFICLPLFIIISILIKIDSKGPIFFLQNRVGRYGKNFTLIKFRSMYVNCETSSSISFRGDKRITNIGCFIRKYKLDELPELINVFLGQMSFVGPRPDVPGYADLLIGDERKILNMRPGITGPATLKYANEEDLLAKQKDPKMYNDSVIYPDKVKINLDYYNNLNLWTDIKIIFATIFRTSY